MPSSKCISENEGMNPPFSWENLIFRRICKWILDRKEVMEQLVLQFFIWTHEDGNEFIPPNVINGLRIQPVIEFHCWQEYTKGKGNKECSNIFWGNVMILDRIYFIQITYIVVWLHPLLTLDNFSAWYNSPPPPKLLVEHDVIHTQLSLLFEDTEVISAQNLWHVFKLPVVYPSQYP